MRQTPPPAAIPFAAEIADGRSPRTPPREINPAGSVLPEMVPHADIQRRRNSVLEALPNQADLLEEIAEVRPSRILDSIAIIHANQRRVRNSRVSDSSTKACVVPRRRARLPANLPIHKVHSGKSSAHDAARRATTFPFH